MLVAVTGGSGFIGTHLRRGLQRAGYSVRCLSRSSAQELPNPVLGSMDDEVSLAHLVDGVDAVIHNAGLVRAVRERSFFEVNTQGSHRLAKACRHANVRRVITISSLAASRPGVSAYAASKRAAEDELVRTLCGHIECHIIRPPAVYGPGDRATFPIFSQMAKGQIVMPATSDARFSMIYVEDLVDLIMHKLSVPSPSCVIEPDDGRERGYSWRTIAEIVGELRGSSVHFLRLPRWVVRGPAAICDWIARWKRQPLPLSVDKLGELFEADWLARSDRVFDWEAKVGFKEGAARTLAWQGAQGWLDLRAFKNLEFP